MTPFAGKTTTVGDGGGKSVSLAKPPSSSPSPPPSTPSSSLSTLLPRVVALGIDTWSLCWYGNPGSSLLTALRSLATVQAGRAYLVPNCVADHRIGWFPEYGLVFAEGHPTAPDLCRPSEITWAADHLLAALAQLGIPISSSESALVRRLDIAVDVSMPSPSSGLALLERLGRESFGSGKVVTYRYHRHVQTVVLKTPAGRSQSRIYDKGVALGTKRPGQLLRFEAQWRFGNGFRPHFETLNAQFLRHRFNSRFARIRDAATAFHLEGIADLADRLGHAVSSGHLRPSRARSLAGYLLLASVGVDQGASRTRFELDRDCRALGISRPPLTTTSLPLLDPVLLFDVCMATDTWLRQ
jgi:hypothetical protein